MLGREKRPLRLPWLWSKGRELETGGEHLLTRCQLLRCRTDGEAWCGGSAGPSLQECLHSSIRHAGVLQGPVMLGCVHGSLQVTPGPQKLKGQLLEDYPEYRPYEQSAS